jgi:hypothetical protein
MHYLHFNSDNAEPHLIGTRIIGIVLCVCVCVRAHTCVSESSLSLLLQYGQWLVIQDLLDSWVQWLVIVALTVMHTLLTFLLPVPNCPTGYLGPGGFHNHSSSPNCTGGAAGYLDRIVFGERHIYQHPTCQHVYKTVTPYDPEGMLKFSSRSENKP